MISRISLSLCGCALAMSLAAAEVSIFRVDERDELLSGEWRDVAVHELGGLRLAVASEELAALEEPYVFTAAGHPEGWVLGTGSSGKVLKVDRRGRVEVLFEAPEREVFAVWADSDGTVFAGTSPHGRVYRIRNGEAAPFFDPGETYIWALARGGEGELLVATGLSARLYRVDAAGRGREVAEVRDAHLRSLTLLPDGRLLLGSAGQGLVLVRAADGRLSTLYDAAQPEVAAFAVLPDGSAYAAILASEASLVDLDRGGGSDDEEDEEEQEGAEVEVVDETVGSGSRSASFEGARSILVHVSATGEVREVRSFEEETIHSLLWHGDSLWLGTGPEGRLYRFEEEHLVLEREYEARQIASLAAGKAGVAVVTTNAGKVHRLGEGFAREGTYTSAAMDADALARFGSFHWRGELPRGTVASFRFRSGISEDPDQTWSEWSEAAEGREIPLGELSRGRHVQWQATLRGDEETPRLLSAELSYRQENQRPRIQAMEVLDAGKILVPNSFNPQAQAYEPWSPNKDGIFTSLRPAETENEGRLKGLWKVGYRTIRWKAEDANKDRLRYALSFRAESDSGEWLPMVEGLEDTYYSFDSTVLPDGFYRFRLEAVDRPPAESAEALVDTEISEPVVVDHSPPELVSAERRDGVLEVRVRDLLSPLRRAELSVDAGAWAPAPAADGMVDGRTETLRLEVPESGGLVLLRVVDASLNSTTFDLLAPP